MAVELQGISKNFGKVLVVSSVSLRVESGELFVLLGSSGSGKSTILRLIAGLTAPDCGRVLIANNDITDRPPQDRGIGFVFQSYALFRHMTVARNVEFGLRLRNVASSECIRIRDEYLEMLGLSGLGNRYPDQLSGGQRQRVALARALAYNPKVLLLDEPFGALDVKIRTRLRKILKSVQQRLKITTILVTHDQEEAFELGDRIGIIERGTLVEVGEPRKLYGSPRSEFVANFIGGGNVLVGAYDRGSIRIGDFAIPLPEGSPAHEQGAPVRILFRPEEVIVAQKEFSGDSGIRTLGQGVLQERVFSGAVERIRFEIENLQGVRPPVAALRFGQRFAAVEALMSARQLEAVAQDQAAPQIVVGSRFWLGVKNFHVLDPSSLRILAAARHPTAVTKAISVAAWLAHMSHGALSVLLRTDVRCDTAADLERLREDLAQQAGVTKSVRFDLRLTKSALPAEVAQEIQAHPYDLVVMQLGSAIDFNTMFGSLRVIFSTLPVPVLLYPQSGEEQGGNSFGRILICTAGGEPGKSDVRFGARVARHTNAAVTVLHVRPPAISDQYRRQIDQHLADAHAMLSALSLAHETRIASGSLTRAVIDELNAADYQMVVLGAPEVGNDQQAGKVHQLIHSIFNEKGIPILFVPMSE